MMKKSMVIILRIFLISCLSASMFGCYIKPDNDAPSTGAVKPKEYYDPIKVASYNIQYDNKNDAVNGWSSRKVILEEILKEMDLDIFGSQEPYKGQIADMMSYLGESYDWVGSDVNGGTTKDRIHYNPIFYKKDRFTVKREGIFWFSTTPDSPSKFDDSYSTRMCYWVLFEDKESGVEFYHFNSHFDHLGGNAKNKSGELLPKKVAEIAEDTPAFCTGDFNSNQRTTAYNNIISSKVLVDARTRAETRINGDWHTFNNYNYVGTPPANATRIDHVFVTSKRTKVNSWEIVNTAYSQKYPSDHFPVVIELSFEK